MIKRFWKVYLWVLVLLNLMAIGGAILASNLPIDRSSYDVSIIQKILGAFQWFAVLAAVFCVYGLAYSRKIAKPTFWKVVFIFAILHCEILVL